MEASRDVSRLIEIMAALREPETGCPWDVEQSFDTIVPYTIEEAYEVADAIERRDADDLREELGDLLLQVVYHAQLAREAGLFGFEDVVEGIITKMIRRHPHVFGDEAARNARSAKGHWERIKAEERAEKLERRAAARGGSPATPKPAGDWTANADDASAPLLLAAVPRAFPALTEALKVQRKAAKVGFDWDSAEAIRAKIDEEFSELEEATASGDLDATREEFGDLLFGLVNLGRFHDVDAEDALRGCTTKFRRRFAHIERSLAAAGRTLDEASLDEMEALWTEAKGLDKPAYEPVDTRTSG